MELIRNRALVLAGLMVAGLALSSGCVKSPNDSLQTYDELKKLPNALVQTGQDVKQADKAKDAPVSTTPDKGVAASAPTPVRTSAAVVAPDLKSPPRIEGASGAKPVSAPDASSSKTARAVPPSGDPPKSAIRPVAASAADAPRPVKLLVPDRAFKTEGREKALRVSYDDLDLLKVLNMDPVTPDAPSLMPAWLKSLDGRRIRIRGFMYPTFQETGVRAFGLARDNQICCFGRSPKIYDVFDVALKEGQATDYIANRPFDVVGVLHIRPELEDGKLYRLYEMDDATVVTK